MIVGDKGNITKVLEAIEIIQKGLCKRIDVCENIKVYACKNIIRIDIKNEVSDGKEK